MSYYSIINENYFSVGFISLFTVVLITSYIILRNDLVSTEDIDELQSNVIRCEILLKDTDFISRFPEAVEFGKEFIKVVKGAPNDLRYKDLFKINTKYIKFLRYESKYMVNKCEDTELRDTISKMGK